MNEYTSSLAHLVALAERRQGLLASLFAIYKQQKGRDNQQLAETLGCDLETLLRLALCERPRPAPHFRQDVEQIAQHLHMNPLQLAKFIRTAESLEDMRQEQDRTTLLAARDYEEPQEDE
jgi:hypothetical protein